MEKGTSQEEWRKPARHAAKVLRRCAGGAERTFESVDTAAGMARAIQRWRKGKDEAELLRGVEFFC